MSPALQVKLLRVLQEGIFLPVGATEPRKADVRIISATNKNLKELVNQGKIREDLYYRINVIKVTLPPLRDRKDDIPLLIDYFINTSTGAKRKKIAGVRPDVLKVLLDYAWPGNIREVQNVLERAVALASSRYITLGELPVEIPQAAEQRRYLEAGVDQSYEASKKAILGAFQKEYLAKILTQTKGNVSEAARQAKINRSSFKTLLKKHAFNSGDFKE